MVGTAFTLLERVLRVVPICRSEKVDPFLRSFVSRPRHDVFKARSKSSFTLRPYQSLRFARPRCRADLRGHHDDLHGSNAVFKACRGAFQPGTLRSSPCPFGANGRDRRPDSETALTTPRGNAISSACVRSSYDKLRIAGISSLPRWISNMYTRFK